MQESSKGRKLTPQERRELLNNPVKLLQTLLGPLGVLYSGLKPAAIETAASQAVRVLSLPFVKQRAGIVCQGIYTGSTAAIRWQVIRGLLCFPPGLHRRSTLSSLDVRRSLC